MTRTLPHTLAGIGLIAALMVMGTLLAGCPQPQAGSNVGAITPVDEPPPAEATEPPGGEIEAAEPSVPAEEGQRAPDFKLVKAGGGEVSLADYAGKVLVIDFWATSCGGCVAEMPAYQELYDSWDHSKVEYLGMSLDTKIEIVEGFLQRKGLHLPMALIDDATRKAYLGEGVTRIPQARVIDQQGVLYRVLDPAHASAEQAAAAVNELLAREQ